MDQFLIDGGRPLRGEIQVSGSKNAALPILIATLLTDDPCEISNVPELRDIRTSVRLLESLGKKVARSGGLIRVSALRRLRSYAPYEIVKQMRASVLAAGPLLGRLGNVRVPIPGGCAIGLRPIDIHLKGFEDLGARRSLESGDILLRGGLRPGAVRLRFPSVGATENLLMAAALLPGRVVISNAAREPEIGDLAEFLTRMGARVGGAGTGRIVVEGARSLRGASHRVIADRIEAGTYLIAAAAAGGELFLAEARADHLDALLEALERAGATVRPQAGGIGLRHKGRPRPVSLATAPYPGFPTDLQAPWMSLMALARGESRLREAIFEKRFLHAAELGRMGARVEARGDSAVVRGVAGLHGAPVMASDIRAGAALIVAALAARGRSAVARVYHIDRGYERPEAKLRAVGARIRRVRR